MKRLYPIFILLLLTVSVAAQDSLAVRQQRIFVYLNDSTENRIDFGCGYIGFHSRNLYIIKELIAAKRYDLITQLLDSRTASTRYLAVSTLLIAHKKSLVKPTPETLLKIDSLKKDSEKITFCSGCTGHWSYSIKNFFSPKSSNKLYQMSIDYLSDHTKSWIKDGIKGK